MTKLRAALIGGLLGAVVTFGAFGVRDGFDAFAALKQRVTNIEQLLIALSRQ